MQIISTTANGLSAEDILSIERYRKHFKGISFACLQERVFAMFLRDQPNETDTLINGAQSIMNTILDSSPDTMVSNMYDGRIAVNMIGVTDGKLSCISAISENTCNFDDPIAIAYLRALCISACRKGEIIAVYTEEK